MSSILRDMATKESKLEMTPMIDVTFLLLIFFMCTIKFKTLEGKLAAYLPKDVGVNSSEAEPKEKVDLVLRVAAEGSRQDPKKIDQPWSGKGSFQYGRDRVITYQIGPRTLSGLDELKKRLEDYHAADPERGMTIDPREDVVNADVMRVLDVAITADFDDITFKGAPTK